MNKNYLATVFLIILANVFYTTVAFSQVKNTKALENAVSDLHLRSIGPAVMGGRISDIAVNPTDKSTWYVAVGSGGVWKTTNRGTTWEPIFDTQKSYSIGTVTIDPNNSEVIWVGTGENVSGRHVAWGDGVYKSVDGGMTWNHMGLKKSEHIGKIVVDPRNSDIVFVAAEGPLWSAGGERGIYKTINGGKTWQLVLEIDTNTGVTDIELDPSNPDVLYAAAYQRRRHTWSLLAGGPKSGIYKSTDNGTTWYQTKTGLPTGPIGKIGLAVTPANANLVYATIEASDKEKGFYISRNKGESWTKGAHYISGGTGPHYYQEIEASPQNPDLVYQMDVFLHVTRDGGKNFNYLGNGREKHSDNHALWIDPEDGNHLIAGTDGGLYESYDEGTTWRHFSNLPISQFYKLDLDNSEPFYNIVGGAQDLGTLIGPSRTTNTEGVRNQDWYVPLGGDGYHSVFDPEDANIVYMEYQEGILQRLDRRSNEVLNIQPQPKPNDPPERWNWDSPIQISPHNNKRLYFGSQRVWKSEDQGNSWVPISEDLTTNTNRYELEMIDNRVWNIDALYDTGAMSKYATLTTISESPKTEGLLFTGSDDGLIHVSEDGGLNWRRSILPKVPTRSFINHIETSNHDTNTVFVVADAHKFGDYSTYLFMSTDRGHTYQSIAGDLPSNTIVWVLKQDHIDHNLLFIGTEYGIYFSPNKGINWIKLKGGVPTIAFRDLELHQQDTDLVGATFGRGFYVLDDYTPLRTISSAIEEKANTLFPVRDAWWYVPNAPMQAKGMPSQGSTSFTTENPPFGAVFTYYLNDLAATAKEVRTKTEKKLIEKKMNVPFPGWEQLRHELNEDQPQVLLLIRDDTNQPIRWIKGSKTKGLHRSSWDLRLAPPNPINLTQPAFKPPWAGEAKGPLVKPGIYSVTLYVVHEGNLKAQGTAQKFTVKPVQTVGAQTDFNAIAQFQEKTSELFRQISSAGRKLGEARNRLRYMKAAILETPKATSKLFSELSLLEQNLLELQVRLYGDPIRQKFNENSSPSLQSRVGLVMNGHWGTRQNPTEVYKQNIEIAATDFKLFKNDLRNYINALQTFEATLEAMDAPYTPGRKFN